MNTSNENTSLVDQAFAICRGRANVRLNGDLVGYDAARKEVFVSRFDGSNISMPVGLFPQYLTGSEFDSLRSLPVWDGSNEVLISRRMLYLVERATSRYKSLLCRDEEGSRCLEFFNGNGDLVRDYGNGRIELVAEVKYED